MGQKVIFLWELGTSRSFLYSIKLKVEYFNLTLAAKQGSHTITAYAVPSYLKLLYCTL